MLPPAFMLAIKIRLLNFVGTHDKILRCRINAAFRLFRNTAFMRQRWQSRRNLSYAPLLILALALAGCTPQGPRALLEGKRLLEHGKYPQAVEQLKTATGLMTTNAQAWNYLGIALHDTGRATEAEKAYQRALALDHDLTEAHYNLGCLWLEENKYNAAKLEFTAYTLRRASSVEGLLKLGSAQLRLRDPAAAEKSFSDALRLSPQNPEAFNGLGLARLQRGRPIEAV